MPSLPIPTLWQQVYWPGDLSPASALALLRHLASDRRRWPVVFEARAHAGHVEYFVGSARRADVAALASTTGVFLVDRAEVRAEPMVAARLKIAPTRVRLGVQPLEDVVRSLLATLARTAGDETLTLQVVLGSALPPQLASTRPKPTRPASLPERLLRMPVHPHEGHTSATNKADSHVFAADIRISACAESPEDARRLIRGVLPAFRLVERAHARISLTPYGRQRVAHPPVRPRMRLRLNLEEALALLAWPIAPDLPGQPSAHPKPLAPTGATGATARLFARASAPGFDQPLGITPEEARFHTLVLGPTGSGKSTVLLNLITRDMRDGRSVVVIDPKADLVRDVLARIPTPRVGDVVVIDPSSARPVGFNPLALGGLPPHLFADQLLAIFTNLFAPLGPRTYDLLNATLLTLAYTERPLTDLPALLTDAAVRRRLVAALPEVAGLTGFWATFEAYAPQQASEVIGPTLSRLRQLLLRPGIRAMLSQPSPAFSLSDLFTKPRIVLVPLNKGLVGSEAARLIGSLLTSSLWQTALAQAAKPQRLRRPVHVYVDEVQSYLALGQDLADALSQSRSLGLAWHVAHQYRRQLPPDMRAALDANAKNKIVFGLAADDAADLARQAPELAAADFMRLPAHGVYTQLTSGGGVPNGWVSAMTMRPPAMCSDPIEVLARSQATYAPRMERPTTPSENASSPEATTGSTAPNESLGRRPRRTS